MSSHQNEGVYFQNKKLVDGGSFQNGADMSMACQLQKIC